MPTALLIAPSLIIAAVLVASAIAKLRTPDDIAGWAGLGVPTALRQPWLVRLHPLGELALAAALVLLGGALGVLAGLVAVVLFAAYLILVVRARARDSNASCACFGARAPITTRTIVRNAWLLAIAATAAVTIGFGPLWGGVIGAARLADWAWIAALVAAAVTVALVTERGAPGVPIRSDASRLETPADTDDDEDYIRVPTPAVAVETGGGVLVNLHKLTTAGPILLLSVSETCTSCAGVIARTEAYRALLPEVDVRHLVRQSPQSSTLTRTEEPQSLHDPDGYLTAALSTWSTPTAVLLGADGLLAGGPITGGDEIESFVGDIYESLHGVRPPVVPQDAPIA